MILNGDHLEVVSKPPLSFWLPQVPIEVQDPWTNDRWYPVEYISCGPEFIFYPSRIRTQNLKCVKVRIKE